MLVLFDQGTPVDIRDFLPEHRVKTAYEQGWSTLLNGDLLDQAERAGFEVLLTTDKNIIHQQNLRGRKIAIVALGKARWSLIEPALPSIRKAIGAAKPGTYTLVDVPSPSRGG